MSTTPYQFIKRGQLFIMPIAPVINEAPPAVQSYSKPREFSLWVRGRIEEPAFQLDHVRMPPSLYQEVRDDLVRFSPVEVTRSAFRRSQHAYVGVIDSKGKPYYFALDSRGMSVREADINDDKVWKTFDQLADHERMMATDKRRVEAGREMAAVSRELSRPQLVIVKSDFDWKRKTPERVGEKKDDGTPIKKPSIYQKLRGLVGKPRTDITDTGDDAPVLPSAKLISKGEVARVKRDGRQLSVSTPAGTAGVPSAREAEEAIQGHLPAGFKVGGAVTLHRTSVHHGEPAGEIDSDALHIMKPSEIAARGVYGNELNPDHLTSIRSAWSEGKKLDPIDVNVTHDGQWHVEDGNHRLHVAAATDTPVAIRFRKVGEAYRPQAGVRDISDRLRSAHAAEKALVDSFLLKAGHTGTMVALHIPRDVADRIVIPGGEPPENMHITVAYLGKDLTEEQKSGALCAVRRISQQNGPITAMLAGVGRFSASQTSEGRDVVYLSVDSPDLTRLRPKLIEELAAEGIEPSNAHGYVPHVTLAYVETSAPTPLKRFPPLAVEFSSISLTVADQQMKLPFRHAGPALYLDLGKALHPHAAWAANELKAGRQVKHENGTHAYPRTGHGSGRTEYAVVSPGGVKTYHDTPEDAGAKAYEHTKDHKPAPLPKATARFKKALPRKAKEETVKKTPSRKASSKKAGAGGKTRYSYPNEKKKPGASGGKNTKLQPLVVAHDDSKHADPAELANQLGVSIRTLKRCAEQHGREGFSKFMRSHLKRFSAKHRLDPDYWGVLYQRLMAGEQPRD